MKLLSRLRREDSSPDQVDADEGAFDPEAAAADETPTRHQWTGASAMTTKAMTLLLWCLLIAGPVALVFQLMTPPPPAPVVQADNTDAQAGERTAVSGFAEDLVVTWLTTPRGQEKMLERFVTDASSLTLAEKPWTVTDPATAYIESTGQRGVWAVTVAVTVAEGKDQPPVRRYFQVPVRYTEGSALRAQTLPAPVAAPAVAVADRLSYRYRATLTDPVAAAANDFLSALLAGSGDVARYVSPGSEIAAIDPAPYTTVVIEDVMVDDDPAEDGTSPESGEERHLLVTATVTAAAKQDVTVQYALTLAARDGRWEVKSIDLAPVVSDPSSGPEATEAPAPEESDTQTPAPNESETPTTSTTN
jgi:hypothetical protein